MNYNFYVVRIYFFLQTLSTLFESNKCDQVLILFGATSHTPKEAFLIRLPAITQNHYAHNHNSSDLATVKAITM